MSGRGITVYTDEDVDPELARQLHRQGYDVISCLEVGNHNQQHSDEWQLSYATSVRRAILVFNTVDFIERDSDWRATGRQHYGIIAALNTTPFSELVRRTVIHLNTYAPHDQYNIILWLPH